MSKVDELGRIVIPSHIREELDIKYGDDLNIEIHIDKETGYKELVLVPKQNHCGLCENTEELILLPDNNYICSRCVSRIKNL